MKGWRMVVAGVACLACLEVANAQEPALDDFLDPAEVPGAAQVDPMVEGAIAAMAAGDFAGAAGELRGLLLQRPDHLQALRLLAVSCIRLNDISQAIQTCQRISALDPSDPGIPAVLGSLYSRIRQADQAEIYYRLALDRNPGDPLAAFGLGWIDLERRQVDAALERVTRVAELAPGFAPNYLLMGRVLTAKGSYAEAARAYRRAFDLSPSLRKRYGILLQELSLRHRIER